MNTIISDDGRLILDLIEGSKEERGVHYWRVRETWHPFCDDLKLHVVDAGFETDLASIPWWLWSIVGSPTDPQFVEAATVHDFYCDKAANEKRYNWRRIGDAFFPEKLMEAGVTDQQATRMFLAVWMNGIVSHKRLIPWRQKSFLGVK